ncbi:MAG: aldo/keto reductase, partial [Devosia sp.]
SGFPEPPVHDWERLWNTIDVINDVAKGHGVSGAQVALAWLLQRPLVASLVIGGRNLAQFEDNLKAISLTLGAEEIGRLDAVSQLPLAYPYWHQNWTAAKRFGAADLALHAPYLKQ